MEETVPSPVCQKNRGRVTVGYGMLQASMTLRTAREATLGGNGFGYDPVFLLPSMGKTFAGLIPSEENAHSHRNRAVRNLVLRLKR